MTVSSCGSVSGTRTAIWLNQLRCLASERRGPSTALPPVEGRASTFAPLSETYTNVVVYTGNCYIGGITLLIIDNRERLPYGRWKGVVTVEDRIRLLRI